MFISSSHTPMTAIQFLENAANLQRKNFGKGSIAMNFHEGADRYVIEARLPGFSKEEISMEIEGDTVSIKASKSPASTPEDLRPIRQEFQSPLEVSRSVAFAVDIDAAAAKARFENGTLIATLPKKLAPKSSLSID